MRCGPYDYAGFSMGWGHVSRMTEGRDGFTGSGSVCYGAGTMVLAGIFGAILFLLLLIGDWYQFTSLGPFSAQYGFGIARRHDRLDTLTRQALVRQFGRHDVIALPHGVARWFAAQEVISLRPSYQLFSMRFRTAWPLKGTITLRSTEARRGIIPDQTRALVVGCAHLDLVGTRDDRHRWPFWSCSGSTGGSIRRAAGSWAWVWRDSAAWSCFSD